jgi:hypothetical protein
MRRFAGLVLALWALSAGAALLHVHGHCDCCDHGQPRQQDEKPCSICLAIQDAPVVALAHAEAFELRSHGPVWTPPFIPTVPADVFYDRPLARGPPSVS